MVDGERHIACFAAEGGRHRGKFGPANFLELRFLGRPLWRVRLLDIIVCKLAGSATSSCHNSDGESNDCSNRQTFYCPWVSFGYCRCFDASRGSK